MDIRTATITIDIEGGIDIDFSKPYEIITKEIIETLLDTLKKRTLNVKSVQEDKVPNETFFNSFGREDILNLKIKQEIEITC